MSRKKKIEVEAPVDLEAVERIKGPKIPFAVWFDKRCKEGLLRETSKAALRVFFKKQGLKDLECAEDYSLAFARY